MKLDVTAQVKLAVVASRNTAAAQFGITETVLAKLAIDASQPPALAPKPVTPAPAPTPAAPKPAVPKPAAPAPVVPPQPVQPTPVSQPAPAAPVQPAAPQPAQPQPAAPVQPAVPAQPAPQVQQSIQGLNEVWQGRDFNKSTDQASVIQYMQAQLAKLREAGVDPLPLQQEFQKLVGHHGATKASWGDIAGQAVQASPTLAAVGGAAHGALQGALGTQLTDAVGSLATGAVDLASKIPGLSAVSDWAKKSLFDRLPPEKQQAAVAAGVDKAKSDQLQKVTAVMDQQGGMASAVDYLKSNPALMAIPLGILAMLMGGKAGKIIGALALAYGGMQLFDKYKQATDPLVAKAIQAQANGVDYAKDPAFQKEVEQAVTAAGMTPGTPEFQQAVSEKMAMIPQGIQAASMAYKAGLFDPKKRADQAAQEFSQLLPPAQQAQPNQQSTATAGGGA